MLEMQEGIREWEIWTPKTVAQLKNLWRDPANRDTHHAKFLETVASLVKGKSVLDVGCGCGHFLSFMQDRDYMGVDVSEHMLNQARLWFPNKNRQFLKGDIYDLSMFAPRDTVVANSVLIHLPEIEPAIQQLWSKTLRQCIFNMHIGKKDYILKRKGYGGNPDKYLINHTTTVQRMFNIFGDLRRLFRVERYPYNNIVGDIFVLTRQLEGLK